jgi:hypothetical protein
MIAKLDNEFWRNIVFPEEERCLYTSAPWNGGYRWFKSENVICIEHYRKPQSATGERPAIDRQNPLKS